MHLKTFLHSKHSFVGERGGFVASSLAIQEKIHVAGLFNDLFEKFKSIEFYVIKNPATWYNLTVNIHEGRHFHDFIESPFSLPLIMTSCDNWSVVRILLHLADLKNVKIPQPAIKHLDKIKTLFGEQIADPLRQLNLYNKYCFNFIEANRQKIEKSKDELFVALNVDSFPPFPVMPARGYVIPIVIKELLEGSAVLSQLSFLSSAVGPDTAKQTWERIEQVSVKDKKFEYVVCLWALQKVFGEDSIFQMEYIRCFRKLFRFSLNGMLPSVLGIPEYSMDDILNLPPIRFTTILENIKAFGLQRSFLDNPQRIMFDISKTLFRNYEKKIKEFLIRLAMVVDDPTLILTEYSGPEEREIIKQVLKLYKTGIESDHSEVDKYFDVLWAQDDGPPLIEAPIHIYKTDDEGPFYISHDNSPGDPSIWLSLYIIDCLIFQFLYTSRMNCPFSYFKSACKKGYNNVVPLFECEEKNCVIKTLSRDFGLKKFQHR